MYQRHATPDRLSLPDVIAAAWTAVIRNWRAVLTIALGGALVSALANWAFLRLAPGVGETGEFATGDASQNAGILGVLGMALVAQTFTHMALVWAALGFLRDKPVSVRSALATGVRRFPVALVAIVIGLVVVVTLLATVILMPLALYLFISWLFTPQIVHDERVGPLTALKRSRALCRGQWWRVCGVGLAILLLSLLPSIVLAPLTGVDDSGLTAAAVAGIAALVSAPFLATGNTLLYLEVAKAAERMPRPTSPPRGDR